MVLVCVCAGIEQELSVGVCLRRTRIARVEFEFPEDSFNW